mmetsp:Transcript_6019/g.21239  ORF Transcript_6019/g.21239 Transcript_6019/m.21239 type:complete len:570 (-) Transcript_6019:683-2392(-)
MFHDDGRNMVGRLSRNDRSMQNENLSLAQQLKQQMQSDRDRKKRMKEEDQSGHQGLLLPSMQGRNNQQDSLSSFLQDHHAERREVLYPPVPGRRLMMEGRLEQQGVNLSAWEQVRPSFLPPMDPWRREEPRAVPAVDPKRAYAEELRMQMEENRQRKQAEKQQERERRGWQPMDAPPQPLPYAFPTARAPPKDFLSPFRLNWREEEKNFLRAPAPLGVKYLSKDPPVKFEERRRPQQELQQDVRASNAQPSRGMDKAAYAAELQAQIEEKKERESRRKQEEREHDERIDRSIEGYDPWGRAGAGAPHRDEEGNVIADLRARGLPAISGEKSLAAYDKFYGVENGRAGAGAGWEGGKQAEDRRWSSAVDGGGMSDEEKEREERNLKQQMLRRDLEEQIEEKKRQRERERLQERELQMKEEARLRRAGVRVPSSLAIGEGDDRLPAIEEELGGAILKTEDQLSGNQEEEDERGKGEEEEDGLLKDFRLYKKTSLSDIRKLDTDEKYAKLQQELRDIIKVQESIRGELARQNVEISRMSSQSTVNVISSKQAKVLMEDYYNNILVVRNRREG